MPLPTPNNLLPQTFDRAQAFLVYASFAGDLERTAMALNIRPEQVLEIADTDGWITRIKPIIELRKSTRPGDVERACNRALNFVLAHRFRMQLERVVTELTGFTAQEFRDQFINPEKIHLKSGEVMRGGMSTRALADLASALEKMAAMSYAALNDTAPERARRKEDGDDSISAADLHMKLAQAMTAANSSNSIRARLFDAQLAQGQALANEKKSAENPHDNDEH